MPLPPSNPSETESSDDTTRGLYSKYYVQRTDGSSLPGGRHENCFFFVLDPTHDPFAMPALRAYIEACKATHPKLALDLTLELALASTP